MSDYVECRDCTFVLQAKAGPDPEPRHWDSCPKCGTAEFDRIERESRDEHGTSVSSPLPEMGG